MDSYAYDIIQNLKNGRSSAKLNCLYHNNGEPFDLSKIHPYSSEENFDEELYSNISQSPRERRRSC